MPVIRALVAGAWVDVAQIGSDEVHVGSAVPTDSGVELWYDTAAVGPVETWVQTWTPTLAQPGAITKTVTAASYTRIGRTIIAMVNLAVTGTGTAANSVQVGLPIPCRATNAIFGVGSLYDASTTTRYICGVYGGLSTSTVALAVDGVSTDLWGVVPSLALASGDGIFFNLTYEAAAGQ